MAPADPRDRRTALLARVYGTAGARRVAPDIEALVDRHRRAPRAFTLDETQAWVIAYPDHVTAPGERPLATLDRFVAAHLAPWISGVHTLPFHPSSGDGGFAVVDPAAVDPAFGTWADLARLGRHTAWMADAVVNHLSAQSPWFRAFLAGDRARADFFVRADPAADTSAVVRPRTTPLVHSFTGAAGPVHVWTTFSGDQVDLDYANPAVLVAMLEVLARYVDHGAQAIRLDAVAFLWKDVSGSSIHLPETHAIVRLIRAVLDDIAPDVVLVTETNVPHAENVAYFGPPDAPGATAVYQFALAPLVLHALLTADTAPLVRWLRGLDPPRAGATFLNFLASHDGIGLRPVEELLDARAVDGLVAATEAAGGVVNRRTAGGRSVPYELAVAWFSALGADHDEATAVARHVAGHAVALALAGVPLFYLNSLFAIGNDTETYARTGHGRDLNRRRSTHAELASVLADANGPGGATWRALRTLLAARRRDPAFHPASPQTVADSSPGTVVVERGAGRRRAVVAVNLSPAAVGVDLPPGTWSDADAATHRGGLTIPPWGVAWLRLRP